MKDFAGKTAFVTGAGSGIGFHIARALAERGTNVMLADRDAERLDRARAQLLAIHPGIDTVICDVADEGAMRAAAAATIARFGKLHVLVNNAGVSLAGRAGQIPLQDWRWIVDINLMGVVMGVELFLPLIRSHGEGGHIVNTASIAGFLAPAFYSPYCATKFAVIGLSESLRAELRDENIKVSVLCPSWVSTDIHNTFHGRPSAGLAASGTAPDPAKNPGEDPGAAGADYAAINVQAGIDAALVGDWTVECIAADRFFVFTHPQGRAYLDRRHARIGKDFDALAADPRFAPDE